MKLANPFHEFFDKLIVNARLDIKAICGNTGLAGIAELRLDRTLDRSVDIGIVKDDERCISS